MKLHRVNGFTLIELMVVVVVVGILATIAMPSYSNYVIRGARQAAQGELLEMSGLQEKIYLNSNGYTANVTATYNGLNTGGLGRTSGQTLNGKYDFSFTGGGQSYTLRARPVAGKTQAGNGCLTIQENGRRLWYEGDDTCTAASPKSW